MKLTIEIDDAHTGDLLQFIAGLTARTVKANPDPAPGHPELPLIGSIDPTRRDLPFPEGLACPELPEGKTRWVYRGNGFDRVYPAEGRHVMWLSVSGKWIPDTKFSHTQIHHIEAI